MALSIGLVFIVLLVVVVLGGTILARLNQLATTVKELERKVDELSSSAVPAFSTFLGTIGIATSELVAPTGVSTLFVFVFAGAAFLFGALAKDQDLRPFLRWVYAAAAIAPFVGAAVAAFESGNFGDLAASTQIALIVALFIGGVGLIGVVRGARSGAAAQETASAV